MALGTGIATIVIGVSGLKAGQMGLKWLDECFIGPQWQQLQALRQEASELLQSIGATDNAQQVLAQGRTVRLLTEQTGIPGRYQHVAMQRAMASGDGVIEVDITALSAKNDADGARAFLALSETLKSGGAMMQQRPSRAGFPHPVADGHPWLLDVCYFTETWLARDSMNPTRSDAKVVLLANRRGLEQFGGCGDGVPESSAGDVWIRNGVNDLLEELGQFAEQERVLLKDIYQPANVAQGAFHMLLLFGGATLILFGIDQLLSKESSSE